jgi:hypothetical protein
VTLCLLALLAGAIALGGGVTPAGSAVLGLAIAALGVLTAVGAPLQRLSGGALGVTLGACGLVLASTLWSVAPDATLDAAVPVLSAATAFLVCACALSRRDASWLVGGLALLGAIVACVALAAVPAGGRAHAPLGNPNHLAAWLLLPGAVACARLVGFELGRRGKREEALLWFGAFGVVGAAIAATGSLGAAVGAMAAVCAALALRVLPGRAGAWTVVGAFAAAAVATLVCPWALPNLVPPAGAEGELSAGLRWQVWNGAAHAAWAALPFGAGAGASADLYTGGRPAGLPYAVVHAHSEPVNALVELGLPGLVLAAVAAVVVARRIAGTPSGATRAWAPAVGVFAVAGHALVDFPLRVPAVSLATFALAGLAWEASASRAALPRRRNRGRDDLREHRGTRWSLAAIGVVLAVVAGTQAASVAGEAETRARLAGGDFAGASRAAEQALRFRPTRPSLLALAADAAEQDYRLGGGGGGALAGALAFRARQAAATPLDPEPLAALARTRALAGDTTGALAAAEEAARLEPSAPARQLALAQLWLVAGRRDYAALAVHAALDLFPRSADAALAALLSATGDPTLMGVAAPDAADMRRSAGLVLANAGYVQAAADQLARASALAPGDPETALAAARALRRAGNPLAAEDVLLRALERVPGETRLAAELSGLRRDRPALHEPDGRS